MKRRIFLLSLVALGVLALAAGCPSSGPSPGPANQTPVAIFSYSQASGESPLTVTFDASTSYDPDGTIVSYEWTYGDGNAGSGKITSHTYSTTTKGVFGVRSSFLVFFALIMRFMKTLYN